jgi:hypothetical protein
MTLGQIVFELCATQVEICKFLLTLQILNKSTRNTELHNNTCCLTFLLSLLTLGQIHFELRATQNKNGRTEGRTEGETGGQG